MNKIKALFSILYVASVFSATSQIANKTQLIQENHWIYDALTTISSECRHPLLLSSVPVTAGELEFNLHQLDRDSMSDSGKALYDEIEKFLTEKDFGFHNNTFHLCANIVLQPELYYKGNKDFAWTPSLNYNYKGDFATLPIKVGISDYFTGEMDWSLAQNHYGQHRDNNFTNIPNGGVKTFEFNTPWWCYGSAGRIFNDEWGLSAFVIRKGLRIGQGLFGSIIYNDTFESNVAFQLNVFNDYFKYNLNVIQIAPNRNESKRFLYLHEFTGNICKRVKLSLIEGTLTSTGFEFQNLNPFSFMHDFGLWEMELEDGKRKDCKTAQYFAIVTEFNPIKNNRFYLNFAMNEITLSFEDEDANPSSLGFQVGYDLRIPSKKAGYWHGQIETIWTMPYLYEKKREANSFYSYRYDIHGENVVTNCIGTPYGRDMLGIGASFGYEQQRTWSLTGSWLLCAKGEDVFRGKLKDTYSSYYPSSVYEFAKEKGNLDDMQAAMDESKRWFPTGTLEFKNFLSLEGAYNLNKYAQFNAKATYIFAFNYDHEAGNFRHGIELLFSYKCIIF